MRKAVEELLCTVAEQLGPIQSGSEWYLFGSVERNAPIAFDIDLLILCHSNEQADNLRRAIDHDEFPLPLDLSLMTFSEAAQVDAVRSQNARLIHPRRNEPTA
ncbi:hypothetical protein [Novosphingobium sp. PhB55]|uniref:hypothetical protein n=1 Tax=Novosphingobium sp. PhB55 TaxID=2485106 RepID=UPI001066C414|nr:hypothetical protein [Novosphingobium sp. PhB55]